MENKKYTNPIIYADYSDPDVCRVGEDYFMVASSFCNAPGLPILHSKDMVNWELINYAIDKIPEEQYDRPLHGCGVWAPAIRYHEGEYIIFFPMPDEGIYVVKTKDPWGKWDEPAKLFEGKGWIDPCPFWDDDGRAYMVSAFAKSRIGFKSILNLCEITPDCLHMIDEGKHIFDGNTTGQETIEGPKMYKRNGYYYIFAPAGGVKQGWQTVLRSRNIWGPYEHRVVMEQKDSLINGPHQGAWVDTESGEDWFIHFQDVYAGGRIVHLQPMRWVDDWPVIGQANEGETCGKPVVKWEMPDTRYADIQKKENENGKIKYFYNKNDDCRLALDWQWNANPKDNWYAIDKDNNQLVLNAVSKKINESIANVPNLLLRKWTRPDFVADTKLILSDMKEGDIAGLVSLGVSYGAIGIERTRTSFLVNAIKGKMTFENERAGAIDGINAINQLPLETEYVHLRYVVKTVASTEVNRDGKYEFPVPAQDITLYYSLDGNTYEEVATFAAVAGRWVGVKYGVFCYKNADNNGEIGGMARFE